MKRKIDEMGRICIPAKYRKEIGFCKKQPVEVSIEYGSICIKPFNGENLQKRSFVGIVRDVDSMCRVTIPREYIDILGFSTRGLYELKVENEKVIIQGEVYDIQ